MANTIKIKNSGTAAAVPTSLEYGELGLNYADGKLFYKNSSNVITQFVGQKGDTGAGGALGYWGSFWSTQTQTAAAINTGYAITFNNSDTNNSGVTLSNNSRINFANAGVYSLIFSIQFANNNNQIQDTNVWFKKNGTNIDASDSKWSIVNSHGGIDGHAIGSVNLVLNLNANDYIELYWQTTSTSVSLEYTAASSPAPSIPSVIFTATQVMYTQLASNTVLDDFQNVTVPTPSSGDFLKYNGSAWINDPINLGTDTVGNYMTDVSAGTGISISHTPGEGSTATITNSGVTSIAGTSNQITASGSTGSVTLSMPSSIVISNNITANENLISNYSVGDEGGEIKLAKPQTNTTLAGQVSIDIYQNKLRFFENGGTARGFYLDIASGGSGAGTNLVSGGGATTLDELTDTIVSTPASGQILEYNGSSWVNKNTVRDNYIRFIMEVI